MEGGLHRVPRPGERQSAARPEPSYRQPEEPRLVNEEPKPVHRSAPVHHTPAPTEKKPKKRLVLPVVIVAVVALLGIGGWIAMSKLQGASTGIDSGKYQAVFFTNGQVYFGKLHAFNNDYLKLTDIYYLQTKASTGTDTSKNPQSTTSDQSNVQLIKLGQEVHGPEDEMVISKDQVLFYENLKSDGKVAQLITQSKH